MPLVLLGGFVGFWGAVVGFLAFGLHPVAALVLWAASGPAGAALAVLASVAGPLLTRRREEPFGRTA